MSSLFPIGTNIKTVMQLLPKDQLDHSYRVGLYVKLLSEKMAEHKQYQDICRNEQYPYWTLAAFYHDIGKICIPSKILSKTGALTSSEYHTIRRHPLFAAELINMVYSGDLIGHSNLPS